jgi:hypothetical protein
MMASAEGFELKGNQAQDSAGQGPMIEETSWGYIIRAHDSDSNVRAAGSVAGRFVGAILLMAAVGLWVMPDSAYGAELFGMKLAAMVMFTVIGGYFVWAGRHVARPEYRIDLKHREVRIGFRSHGNGFRQSGRIDFDSISSVFLLRSKDYRPTRLFLRLADLGTGLELASGNKDRMESLKQRLTDDLSGQARQPVERRLGRHQSVAA